MFKVEAELMPACTLPLEDTKLYIEWMWSQRERTHLDPEVLSYARTCFAKAALQDKTVAIVPIHPVYMIESLGREESLKNSETALALFRIQEKLMEANQFVGFGEAFFMTQDPQFAEIASRHGWTVALYDPEKKTFLMKLKMPKLQIPDSIIEAT